MGVDPEFFSYCPLPPAEPLSQPAPFCAHQRASRRALAGGAKDRTYWNGWNRLAFDRAAPISPFHLPLRAAWSRAKQTGLVPGRGQFRKRSPRSAQLPLSDNDFSGYQQPTPTPNQTWAHAWPAAMGKLQSTSAIGPTITVIIEPSPTPDNNGRMRDCRCSLA